MEYILAIVASSLESLCVELDRFCASKDGEFAYSQMALGTHFGSSALGRGEIEGLLERELEEQIVLRYAHDCDLGKLAKYWIRGSDLPILVLDESCVGRMVSLPPYPFEPTTIDVSPGTFTPRTFEAFFPAARM